MLNVPNNIKSLFQRDGVRKNFRVHFPVGEMQDITNGNIVAESVKFTESCMSQNVFRFGCAESSVVEFETVGIGNMYGMTIECGIEIDTSSLSAAQLSAISSNPGDGVLVPKNESDIGFGYYRVPYGVFTVTNCQRNHESMTHRQVTAMTPSLLRDSPCERMKKVWFPEIKTLRENAKPQFLAVAANNTPGLLENLGYTKTQVADWNDFSLKTAAQTYLSLDRPNVDGTLYYSFRVSTIGGGVLDFQGSSSNPWSDIDALYEIDIGGMDADGLYSFISGNILKYNIDIGQYSDTLLKDIPMEGLLANSIATRGLFPYLLRYPLDAGYQLQCEVLRSDMPCFYPKAASTSNNANNYWRFGFNGVYSVELCVSANEGDSNPTVIDSWSADQPTTPVVYKWSPPSADALDTLVLSYAPSAKEKAGGVIHYSWFDSLTAESVVQSYLELTAQLLRPTRFGSSLVFRLDNSNPVPITADSLSEAWWDEYDVEPIGTVVYAWGANGTPRKMHYGGGASVYTFDENNILKNREGVTDANAKTLVITEFCQNTDAVSFTPAEITMKAWPWVEAGDAIEITTADGVVVGTYVMSHTISGIQNLMDSIVSTGGEIAGGVS